MDEMGGVMITLVAWGWSGALLIIGLEIRFFLL